jgi:hypothetical protein
MQRNILTVAALMTVAGTISACNSTDALYDQGPWGPGYARKSYPEYSAPWGRRLAEPSQYAVSEPAALPIDMIEIDVVQPTRRREVVLETDIGPVPAAQDVVTLAPSEPTILTAPTPVAPGHPPLAASPAPAGAHPSPPGVFSAPQRASSYAGTWNAKVGASSCKVQLSSVPSLDLYKASTQGCTHEAMRSVNGWSFRENQVILFSRGQLVARLSGAEAALTGTLNGSSSEISMSR